MPDNEVWEYTLSIPHDPRAVTVCRRTVRLVLTMHGLIGLSDVAELLATELVTNAVRHTSGSTALRLTRRSGALRIAAWDEDPQAPDAPACAAASEAETGRGLMLVQACADAWGWQPEARYGGSGKLVWCDLGAA